MEKFFLIIIRVLESLCDGKKKVIHDQQNTCHHESHQVSKKSVVTIIFNNRHFIEGPVSTPLLSLLGVKILIQVAGQIFCKHQRNQN